jgi:chemotaxis methyl-accepting protein methylase
MTATTHEQSFRPHILLDELTARADRGPGWHILATDLSEPDLTLARAGVYPSTELGNVRLRHLACFDHQGQAYAVAAHLEEQVEFAVYDLLETTTTSPPESIYGNFDLVLCCNVLYYYRQPQQGRILDKLLGCLAPGGYLVTGRTERHLVRRTQSLYEMTACAPVFQTPTR